MSVISGIINLRNDESFKEKIMCAMVYNESVSCRSYSDNMCSLFYGSQFMDVIPEEIDPMYLDWAGERYAITFSGELYNADDLRGKLRQQGHEFRHISDAEVVLHAYVQWGICALEKLNGVFAFAIWCANANKLFIARDRMGVKPLFYTLHEGGLLFASEIKAILAYPSIRAELDEDGISQIILLGPGRRPGSGVLKNIFEIEPGSYADFHNGKLKIKQYWTLKDREHEENFEETAEHVRSMVRDSVIRQSVSCKTIGTFLSGGLDSSIITAVCAGKLAEKGQLLSTFSVDYADNHKNFTPGKFQPESDNAYIEIMCNFLNCNHYWTVLNATELYSVLDDTTVARGLPGMADVDASLLLFCRRIAEHVSVALSGECADEIFGGYPWFRDPEIRAPDGFPWAQNTQYRACFLNKEFSSKISAYEYVMDHYNSSVKQCDILPCSSDEDRQVKLMTFLNHRWFMQTLIERNEKMSMYSGIKIRAPFCDDQIASYLYGVPWKYKNYRNREKGLLRYAMQGLLPEKILWRKKSPYPKTHDPLYSQLVKEKLRSLLCSQNAPLFQIVDRQALQMLLDDEFKWPWYGQLMKGPQTIAYMLQINAWMEKFHISVGA